MSEAVNNPSHYSPNGVDSFMHMKDQMGREAFEGFLQGNVIKYVQRHKFKGKPVEDLNKAFFYLAHLYFECGGDLHALVETTNHAQRHYSNIIKDSGPVESLGDQCSTGVHAVGYTTERTS